MSLSLSLSRVFTCRPTKILWRFSTKRNNVSTFHHKLVPLSVFYRLFIDSLLSVCLTSSNRHMYSSIKVCMYESKPFIINIMIIIIMTVIFDVITQFWTMLTYYSWSATKNQTHRPTHTHTHISEIDISVHINNSTRDCPVNGQNSNWHWQSSQNWSIHTHTHRQLYLDKHINVAPLCATGSGAAHAVTLFNSTSTAWSSLPLAFSSAPLDGCTPTIPHDKHMHINHGQSLEIQNLRVFHREHFVVRVRRKKKQIEKFRTSSCYVIIFSNHQETMNA